MNNPKLVNLKITLYNLLMTLDESEGLSDTDSEILFQLQNDPELEGKLDCGIVEDQII